MQNKYKEAQTHLQTTPEMRARLLQAVEKANEKTAVERQPIRFGQRARHAAALAACLVIAVAAFGVSRNLRTPDPVQPSLTSDTLTPDSVQEKLNFTLYAPSVLPEGYTLTDCTASAHAVTLSYTHGDAAITYTMSENISYPAGIGAPETDEPQIIPHDAEVAASVTVGDRFVTLYGGENAYLYAAWYDAGNNFQLAFSMPLAEADVIALIESIGPCA